MKVLVVVFFGRYRSFCGWFSYVNIVLSFTNKQTLAAFVSLRHTVCVVCFCMDVWAYIIVPHVLYVLREWNELDRATFWLWYLPSVCIDDAKLMGLTAGSPLSSSSIWLKWTQVWRSCPVLLFLSFIVLYLTNHASTYLMNMYMYQTYT